MSKEIVFSDEMRKRVYAGAHKVAQVVASTIGPAGRTVICDKGYSPLISRDGVTVAGLVDLEDPVENLGASLMKGISSTTDGDCGDGTSTATVLADAIIAEGLKAVDNGVNPIKLKNGIGQAVEDIVEELKSVTKEIETEEQICQVAAISANNDPEIGKLIAEAIDMVGSAGVITTGESQSGITSTEFYEGMSFDNGYLSPYFSTDKDNFVVEFNNPYILMTDKSINSISPIVHILEDASKSGRPLLIISDGVEGEALSTLIVNALRGVIKVCAVKAPGFGDRKKDMLEDIAVLTGGQVITEDVGLTLDRATEDLLGIASTVKVTKDRTTIIGGAGEKSAIDNRVAKVKKEISEATSDYDREKLQERLAKLAGGVAVLKIGDISETALKEKKYRVEDALNATRAAIEEGIVPGGGTALVQIAKKLSEKEVAGDADYKRGYNIVIKAIENPLKQIVENAGLSGEVVADKVKNSPVGIGFDALNGEYVDMIKSGIIDPVKVTKGALKNAASVSSLILTSSATITNKPEPKECQCGGQQGPTMMPM